MIQPELVNIGDYVTHSKMGRIQVKGINEHCSSPTSKSYAITYHGGFIFTIALT